MEQKTVVNLELLLVKTGGREGIVAITNVVSLFTIFCKFVVKFWEKTTTSKKDEIVFEKEPEEDQENQENQENQEIQEIQKNQENQETDIIKMDKIYRSK